MMIKYRRARARAHTHTRARTHAHTHTHTHTHTILKALEHIQNLQLTEDAEKIVLVNTDSKITLATL